MTCYLQQHYSYYYLDASEYTEYDEELFEDDANAITSQGLYDEQDVQARKEAVRKHLARSR